MRLTQKALDDAMPPESILDALTVAMRVVGERFQRNEIYVPEMLIAARAMKEATALLEPTLVRAGLWPIATAVIGTVMGDLHDIGKNLVAIMRKGANIAVVDLGTDVPPERFVSAAKEHAARIIGVSALLTTTMVGMREVVAAVRAAGLNRTKVVVGGTPVTGDFARDIWADGYASNAGAAVEVAHALLARVAAQP